MSETVQPAAGQKSMLVRVFVVILGVVAMIGGGVQMYRGIGEMKGAGDGAEVERLLEQSDQSLAEAKKSLSAVEPRFVKLLEALDNDGLETVRKDKQQEVRDMIDGWGKVSEQCRTAAKELDEAAEHPGTEKMRPYLAGMSKAYLLFAEGYGRNGEIARTILDDPAKKLEDLLPKIKTAAEQREAEIKQGNDEVAKAEELAKQLQRK
jgi:hypothetical protein